MNRFAVIMAVLVVGFGALVYANQKDPIEQGETSSQIAGEGASGVTLIEYGDFQCPACGQYFPIVNAIKEAYGDEISFQFRHFPLIASHPLAMTAHRAAEAAGKQGKFMGMHDLLFERQQEWSQSNNAQDIFDGYANELGLDMEQYKTDIASSEVLATINADRARGEEQGVESTPTFFINEERIENPRSPEEFFAIIDEFIEEETGEPSVNSPLNQPENDAVIPEEESDLSDVEPTEDTSD